MEAHMVSDEYRGFQPEVIYCAGSSWDAPAGTDRHIASHLSKWAPVLYVDPALSIRPRNLQKLKKPRLQKINNALFRFTPWITPGATRWGLRKLSMLTAQKSIQHAIRPIDSSVRAVIVASLDDLFCICTRGTRVFFGTDDFVSGASLMRLSHDWAIQREAAQLRAADTIVVVSDPIAERWGRMGYNTHVIPNGCDCNAFVNVDEISPANDVDLPLPIAGLVGQLSERIDLAYLEAVADAGVSLLLIGPVSATIDRKRFDGLTNRPNVQWLGPRPFEELPSYLRLVAVGLTPYVDSDFNRASYPLKTLEYLAAGRSAIVSDLPAHRSLDSGFIRIAKTSKEFASITVEELAKPDSQDLRMSRRAFAADHSWDKRAGEFARLLGFENDSDRVLDDRI
jgi:teichuronic acid biosynthesis glycosyltransferase TuaH